MRQGSNPRRSRGRGPRKPHAGGKQTFDSNGPDIRVRGSAYQVLEKYLAMARDATSAGDRVAAENYLQHAEHYYRILNANSGEQHGPNGRSRGNGRSDANGFDRSDGARKDGVRNDEDREDEADEAEPSRRRSARTTSSQSMGDGAVDGSIDAGIEGADEPTEGIV